MHDTSFTVRKRENGKYQAIIRQKINGTWKQVESKGGFDKKIQGQQWANKRVAYWQNKTFNTFEEMTIGQLKEIYLGDLKERVAIRTYENVSSQLRESFLDDKVITQITTYEYRKFIKEKPKTMSMRMSAFYNYLISDLKINIDNPFSKVKHKQISEKRALSQYEFDSIIKTIENSNHRHKDEVILGCKISYYAGLRISEIGGILIDDVANQSIKVDKQYFSHKLGFTPPKSKYGYRTVPIPYHLYKDIKNYIKNKNYINMDKRIFSYTSGSLGQAHTKTLKGSEYEDITYHYYRHSYISRLVQGGLDLKTTAYLAGDKLETIVKTYIHLTEDNFSIAKNFVNNNL